MLHKVHTLFFRCISVCKVREKGSVEINNRDSKFTCLRFITICTQNVGVITISTSFALYSGSTCLKAAQTQNEQFFAKDEYNIRTVLFLLSFYLQWIVLGLLLSEPSHHNRSGQV